jgi:hypothetical protein
VLLQILSFVVLCLSTNMPNFTFILERAFASSDRSEVGSDKEYDYISYVTKARLHYKDYHR